MSSQKKGFKFISKSPQCYLSNFFGGAEFTYMSYRTNNPRLRELYRYLGDVDWEKDYAYFKQGRQKLAPVNLKKQTEKQLDHYKKDNNHDGGFKVGAGVLAKLISQCFKSNYAERLLEWESSPQDQRKKNPPSKKAIDKRLDAVNSIAKRCKLRNAGKITSEDFIDGDPLQKKEWMLRALTLKYEKPFYRDILLNAPDGVYESKGREGDALWTGKYDSVVLSGVQMPTNGLLGHCLSIIKARILQSLRLQQPKIIGQYVQAVMEQERAPSAGLEEEEEEEEEEEQEEAAAPTRKKTRIKAPKNHRIKADIYTMDNYLEGIKQLKNGGKEAIIIDAGIILPFDGDIMVKYWNNRVKKKFNVPVPISADDLLDNIEKYAGTGDHIGHALPGISGGMWHTYATEAHDSALASPVVGKIFKEITETEDWEVRPNRIRVNPVSDDDGWKKAHLEGDHVRVQNARIVCILCVTEGRTFTYYKGSNNCPAARKIWNAAGPPSTNFMLLPKDVLEANANKWQRTTITTTKPGQIILFANSVIHEISRLGKSLSLFLSPFNPNPELVGNSDNFYDPILFDENDHPYRAKEPRSIKRKETLLKKARKEATELKDNTPGAPPFPIRLATSGQRRNWPSEFSGLTRKQCDILGSLFNGPGAYWPSGKATFPLFHWMASGAFQYKLLPFMFVAVQEMEKKEKKDKSKKKVVPRIKFNWEFLTKKLVETPIPGCISNQVFEWHKQKNIMSEEEVAGYAQEIGFNPTYFQSLPFWNITQFEKQAMKGKYTGIPNIAWSFIEFWTKDIRKCPDKVAVRRGYINKKMTKTEKELLIKIKTLQATTSSIIYLQLKIDNIEKTIDKIKQTIDEDELTESKKKSAEKKIEKRIIEKEELEEEILKKQAPKEKLEIEIKKLKIEIALNIGKVLPLSTLHVTVSVPGEQHFAEIMIENIRKLFNEETDIVSYQMKYICSGSISIKISYNSPFEQTCEDMRQIVIGNFENWMESHFPIRCNEVPVHGWTIRLTPLGLDRLKELKKRKEQEGEDYAECPSLVYQSSSSRPEGALCVKPGLNSLKNALKNAKENGISVIFLENGVHDEQGKEVVIDFPITIIGESKDGCIIIGGLEMNGKKEDNVNVKHLTISQSKGNGVTGYRGMSFHLFHLNIEKSEYSCVVVYDTKRNTMSNCQVSHSKVSGVLVNGGLITINGNSTSIHNNNTDGFDDAYDLDSINSFSSIHLVSPLTIESVSINNGGGGNYGGNGLIAIVDNEGTIVTTIQEASDDY